MNKNLDAKLLVVMMSTHERLGADSGLEVLEDHIVKHSCDIFCNESKASSWVISRPSSVIKAGRHPSWARPVPWLASSTTTSKQVRLKIKETGVTKDETP